MKFTALSKKMYKSNSEYHYEFLSNESLILIKDSFYIQTVLGIKLPLNESYTNYSPVLLEQILQEQLILENFYETLKKYLDKGKESVGKVIDVIKSPADIATLLKNLIDNPELLRVVNETYRNKINNFVKDFKDKLTSIVDLLKKPIELLKGLKSEDNENTEEGVNFFQGFIDGILGYVTKVTDFLNKNITDGWSGLLKAILFNGALSYVNDKINFYYKKITGILKMVVKPIDFFKDSIKKEFSDTKKEFSDGLKNNLTNIMGQLGDLAKDSFDKINSFFTGIASKYKWLWTATVGYLSSIAKSIASKIKFAGTDNKIDLTHYGRLTRDLKKIESFKKDTVKIINEKNGNLKITDIYNNKNNMSKLNEMAKYKDTYIITTWYNKKIIDVKTFDNIKDARSYIETLDAELMPFKMLPKKKYYDFRSVPTNIKSEQYIYNKKENMSKLNKLIKENINNLLEGSEMFDDMTVAFGVKHKSNNLSDAEKNQFGPMGQLKNDKGGSFQNPGFPGKAITDNSKKESGKEAQDYYKEVLKKVMDYQNPNDEEEFDAPKTPTNTSDVETENERLKLTGYDTGVSGMEVVMDKAAESGGSEMSKKNYKERMDKIQGDKMNYDYMKKSARKTNDLKYKKDAQNGRPVKAQKSKQPENLGENLIKEFKTSPDPQKMFDYIKKYILDKYPQLKDKIDQPTEKAQIIALFAQEFGINASQLSMVKSVIDKAKKEEPPQETAEVKESYEGVNSKNIFKVKGTITSENQIKKLVEKLPSRVKIDETVFVITDGENTYKLIWEGEEHNGEATIKNFRNNQMVNEDIQKMKHLWDFNTKEKYEFKNNITENGDEAFKRIFKIVKNK